MYCIARRCVLPSFSKEQAKSLLAEAALQSLADLFEAVPDPRGAHGLRYDLPFLLTCLLQRCCVTAMGAGRRPMVSQSCSQVAGLFGPRLF